MKTKNLHCINAIHAAYLLSTLDTNQSSKLVQGIKVSECSFCPRCGVCTVHEHCQCPRYEVTGKLKPIRWRYEISDAERARRSKQMTANMEKRYNKK